MNQLTTFDFESHAVRSVMIDDEPWFVGKDICRCLEIGNHNDALSRLDDDERKGVGITDPLGKNEQQATCISEPGVYRLVFTSRKEEAERFKRWLAHDVLPAIRKTGRYETAPAPVANDHPIDDVLKAWSAVRECRRLMGSKAARAYMNQFPELPSPEELLANVKNPLVKFLKDVMEPDSGGRLQSGEFYQLYVDWCHIRGMDPISQSNFGRQLSGLGIEKQPSNGRIFRLGWKVKG